MGEGRVEAGTGGRLYSSAQEVEGPNACFATDAASGPPPAASAGADEGTVERVKTGSLTPRPGETYEQCVNNPALKRVLQNRAGRELPPAPDMDRPGA
jgi:hypothetical protein